MAWGIYYQHGKHAELIDTRATAEKAFERACNIAYDTACNEADNLGRHAYYELYYNHLAHMSIRGAGIELYRLRSLHGADYDAFWRRYSFLLLQSPLRFNFFWIAIKATARVTMQTRSLDDLIRGIQVGMGAEKPLRPYARLQLYEVNNAEPDAFAYKCLIRARRGGN